MKQEEYDQLIEVLGLTGLSESDLSSVIENRGLGRAYEEFQQAQEEHRKIGEVLEGSPYSPPDLNLEVIETLVDIRDKKNSQRSSWERVASALESSSANEVSDQLFDRYKTPYIHHTNRLYETS